jgi:hypothetical protein
LHHPVAHKSPTANTNANTYLPVYSAIYSSRLFMYFRFLPFCSLLYIPARLCHLSKLCLLHPSFSPALLGGAKNLKPLTECMKAFEQQEIVPFIVDSSFLSPDIEYAYFYVSPLMYPSCINNNGPPIHGLAPACVLVRAPLHILVSRLFAHQLKVLFQSHTIVLT